MPQGEGTYGKKRGRPRKQAKTIEGEIENLMKESDRQDRKKVRREKSATLKKGKRYTFMYYNKERTGKFRGMNDTGKRAQMELPNGDIVSIKAETIK